jgi:hypothetical protein
MRFTFKREAAIMTALFAVPMLATFLAHLFRVLLGR